MSDLDDLIHERSQAYSQKSEYKAQVKDTENKIERLRDAVGQVDGSKR